MIGAIIGDTVGSVYEFNNIKTTDFPLFCLGDNFRQSSYPTDDSVMSMAVAEWLLIDQNRTQEQLEASLVKWGEKFPMAGYGGGFLRWLFEPQTLRDYDTNTTKSERHPYNSWGNGSAMRCSACGFVAKSIDDALDLAKRSAIITHNHPEGVKGAQATATAIYLGLHGANKAEIKQFIVDNFGYDLSQSCDEIRPTYRFDESCQGTLPAALAAFFDSADYESAIRLAVSLGGDSDTIACITGGIAEAYYKEIPTEILETIHNILPQDWWQIISQVSCIKFDFEKEK